MRQKKFGLVLVKAVSSITNYVVLAVLLLCLVLGCYALLDSSLVYEETSTQEYAVYRPDADNALTFEDLKAINDETIGWINVYGTNVNYPIVQGEDNDKYIDHTAKNTYSSAGAIFLDYRNKPDLTDFNSIIYGHHMAEHAMFGDLDQFQDRTFFDEHEYGSLYLDRRQGQKEYGMTFFAFVETEGNNSELFTPGLEGTEARQAYLDYIQDHAMYWRDVSVTPEDQIVLLYTCTENLTNGRHVLVAKLTDEVRPDAFAKNEDRRFHVDAYSLWKQFTKVPIIFWSLGLLTVLLVIRYFYERHLRKKRSKIES